MEEELKLVLSNCPVDGGRGGEIGGDGCWKGVWGMMGGGGRIGEMMVGEGEVGEDKWGIEE